MTTTAQVRIAVAGHAAVGKTTLVRTLLKREVGKVGFLPGTTTYPEVYEQFKARFGYVIDCPGLQHAQIIWDHE